MVSTSAVRGAGAIPLYELYLAVFRAFEERVWQRGKRGGWTLIPEEHSQEVMLLTVDVPRAQTKHYEKKITLSEQALRGNLRYHTYRKDFVWFCICIGGRSPQVLGIPLGKAAVSADLSSLRQQYEVPYITYK